MEIKNTKFVELSSEDVHRILGAAVQAETGHHVDIATEPGKAAMPGVKITLGAVIPKAPMSTIAAEANTLRDYATRVEQARLSGQEQMIRELLNRMTSICATMHSESSIRERGPKTGTPGAKAPKLSDAAKLDKLIHLVLALRAARQLAAGGDEKRLRRSSPVGAALADLFDWIDANGPVGGRPEDEDDFL